MTKPIAPQIVTVEWSADGDHNTHRTTTVNLANSRERGLDDLDAIRRIIAIHDLHSLAAADTITVHGAWSDVEPTDARDTDQFLLNGSWHDAAGVYYRDNRQRVTITWPQGGRMGGPSSALEGRVRRPLTTINN